MRRWSAVVAAALGLGATACAGTAYVSHRPSPAGSAPANPRAEALWTVVLQGYAARAVLLERAQASHAVSGVPPRPIQRVTLRTRVDQDPSPYHRAWLSRLLAHGTVDAVCDSGKVEACPDSVMTDFLFLEAPQYLGDSTASVDLWDAVMDPAECRRGVAGGRAEFLHVRFDLHLADSGWRVVRAVREGTGPSICRLAAKRPPEFRRILVGDTLPGLAGKVVPRGAPIPQSLAGHGPPRGSPILPRDSLRVRPSVVVDTATSFTLHGLVTDSSTGRPVPDAQVMIVGTNLLTHTDSLGAFTLRVASPGRFTVRAYQIGYGPGELRNLLPDDAADVIRLVLPPRRIEVSF